MLKKLYKGTCLVAAIGGLLFFLSCERDNVGPFVGQQYVNAPADLVVDTLIVPSTAINLEDDSAVISAPLSHNVSWYLTLTGLQSNAVQTFSGISDNVYVEWNGSHDGLYFFRANEQVKTELTFVGNDLTVSDTFTITKPKTYSGMPLFGPAAIGFEKMPAWPDFPFAEDGEQGVSTEVSLSRSVEGLASFYMEGADINNTYFISGIRDQICVPPCNQWFNFPTNNPDSIFINVFVYGTGNEATMGGIGIGEDDDKDGLYEDAKFHSEDGWDFQFRVNWVGWRLVSAPYSSFQRSTNPEYGGTGNAIREPDRIKQITFNLLSSPPTNQVEIYYDFPIVTFGKPFNPHE